MAETIVSFISCRNTNIWQRRSPESLDFSPVKIEPLELFKKIEELESIKNTVDADIFFKTSGEITEDTFVLVDIRL